jgi:hypothetical protein
LVSLFSRKVVDNPLETQTHPRDVEVHQQAERDPRQLQVGLELRLMNREQHIGRLEFDNDEVFDDNIQTITGVYAKAPVVERKQALTFNRDAAEPELVTKAGFVCRLEESET